MFNEWWVNKNCPEELTEATVASIYKKGDTSKQENYRPISLLPALYKIFAHILKQIIEKGATKIIAKNTIRL